MVDNLFINDNGVDAMLLYTHTVKRDINNIIIMKSDWGKFIKVKNEQFDFIEIGFYDQNNSLLTEIENRVSVSVLISMA